MKTSPSSAAGYMHDGHFGFLNLPFTVTPDPQFFYTNPVYQEAFATLRYGIEGRKGFVVITGEVGTGKTTLLKLFMQSVDSTVQTAFIHNPQLSPAELVRFIVSDLGILHSGTNRFTLMERLNDYLIAQHKKGHIVALLVDEAQDLSDESLEELRLLSNFETDSDKLIQIVLVGQLELERRLNQPELRQLKQRVALRCRLAPLAGREIGPYINHRLTTAGYKGKELFDAEAVARIIRYSKGIPRLVNLICDSALLFAYTASADKVSAETVEEVVRDLKLSAPPEIKRAVTAAEFETSEIVDDKQVEEAREPEFDVRDAEPTQHRRDRTPVTVGMGMLVSFLLLAGIGAFTYSQQSREYVSEFGQSVTNVSQQSGVYFSEIAARVVAYSQQSSDYVADLAMKVSDVSRGSIDGLSNMATSVGGYLRQARESVSQSAVSAKDYFRQTASDLSAKVERIPRTSDDARGNFSLDGSRDLTPAQPSNTSPADQNSPSIVANLKSPEPSHNNNVGPEPKSKQSAELQKPKDAVIDDRTRTTTTVGRDNLAPRVQTRVPPLRGGSGQLEDHGSGKKEEPQLSIGNFEVVKNSFLRDKPGSSAAIIATFEPGTWVRVESKSGEYFRVRSLNDDSVRGYVHQDDAFFERIARRR